MGGLSEPFMPSIRCVSGVYQVRIIARSIVRTGSLATTSSSMEAIPSAWTWRGVGGYVQGSRRGEYVEGRVRGGYVEGRWLWVKVSTQKVAVGAGKQTATSRQRADRGVPEGIDLTVRNAARLAVYVEMTRRRMKPSITCVWGGEWVRGGVRSEM